MELFKNISGYRDKVIHIAQLKTEHLSGLKCVKIVLSNLCVNSELDILTIVRNDRNTVEIVADI